jgi:hypothetical protein
VVHQEERPDRSSPWVIVALVVSAAFWIMTGIILLVLLGYI